MSQLLRFGIDHDMDESELNRREAYEIMFRRRALAGLFCLNQIERFMGSRNLFYIWTHEDATFEFAVHSSDDETQVYFQRDWSKRGFLRAPYKMCISDPGLNLRGYYRVRSVAQLKRALDRWDGVRAKKMFMK